MSTTDQSWLRSRGKGILATLAFMVGCFGWAAISEYISTANDISETASAPPATTTRPTTQNGATTANTASSGTSADTAKSPRSADNNRLTQQDIDDLVGGIDQCLSVPQGAKEQYVTVDLMISFNPDGSVKGRPEVVRTPSTPLETALAAAAVKAVLECAPYPVVRRRYDLLSQVQMTVDPSTF